LSRLNDSTRMRSYFTEIANPTLADPVARGPVGSFGGAGGPGWGCVGTAFVSTDVRTHDPCVLEVCIKVCSEDVRGHDALGSGSPA
jgi:hypothetical protein